jgi:hypothetical protein
MIAFAGTVKRRLIGLRRFKGLVNPKMKTGGIAQDPKER